MRHSFILLIMLGLLIQMPLMTRNYSILSSLGHHSLSLFKLLTGNLCRLQGLEIPTFIPLYHMSQLHHISPPIFFQLKKISNNFSCSKIVYFSHYVF